MIQEKIKNGEGYIEVETLGIIPAKQYDELTDPKWDLTLEDYKDQIELYKQQYGEGTKEYEKKMIEISENLKSKRKALNVDYLENQKKQCKYFSKHDYMPIENESDPLILKTEEYKLQEKKLKIQQEILTKLKPLMDAMTFQEITKQKGSNSANAIFSDDDIKNWDDYISEIANGNLEVEQPELSENIKKLIGI